MAKAIRQRIRDQNGPPRVQVRCSGHTSYRRGPLSTLYEMGRKEVTFQYPFDCADDNHIEAILRCLAEMNGHLAA